MDSHFLNSELKTATIYLRSAFTAMFLKTDCNADGNKLVDDAMYCNQLPSKASSSSKRSISNCSKFALLVGLIVILIIVVSILTIGYFINIKTCKDHAEITTQKFETLTGTNSSGGATQQKTQNEGILGSVLDQISDGIHLSRYSSSFKSSRVKRSVNLEGRVFQIHAKENNEFWHFDGGHPVLKVVSSLWQPNDDFVKFTFEKQTDGSYKIKSVAMPRYMYDGYNVPGARGIYLNGDDQTDDDHMRYYITMETQGYYRIKTKATNRYVRLDPDKYVSSRFNIADDRSLFKLVEVNKVNLEGKVFKIQAKNNNKFWHFDGGHRVLKVVSSLWQPNDDFVKFTFEKQTDGSYKIKSFAMPRYMYDGYGVSGARGVYLNGDDQTDDDHMRYYIIMETQGYYRIMTKATNRYVRLDPDKYVSSRFNIADDRSLFKLVEVHKVNLEGKIFKIQAKDNNKFWHFDGGHRVLKVVSSLWQPNDDFVRFTFEKQTDGSYKIKSFAMPRYMYDGYGVSGARGIYLNGDDQMDDDHMRYYITMETQGYYRIMTKATNRYVRLDPDKYVSSRFNIADDRSLFKLIEVQKVNIEGKVFKIQAKENNKFWHFDGGHRVLKVVSSLWQPNDDFVKFTFEKQTDGSYKIKSVAMPRYMYDGYGVSGARGIYLNGDDQKDDDHMRYFVTMETQGYYRIKTKATNRYVRLDPDKYVSSRFNIADDRSLFKLVNV